MWYEGRSDLYGLYNTAWNKVTLGINCPTTLHYDDKNCGLTALLVVGLFGLKGGTHALMRHVCFRLRSQEGFEQKSPV